GGAGEKNSRAPAPPATPLLGDGATELFRESAAYALERFGELRGNDPQLVGLALGDLRQRQQVLVGEQLRVGVTIVDGLEDRRDGLRLTLRAEHCGLRLALGSQDGRLAGTLGLEDRRLLRALRGEDRRSTVTLGAHLLLHRVLNREGRVDRLELDTVDADTPLACRLVEHDA